MEIFSLTTKQYNLKKNNTICVRKDILKKTQNLGV